MDFKNSYRVEAVYFQKLKSDIDIAKSYIAAGATDEARAVLENLVDVDGAVLLLYRNIGECWAELANAIEKTKKELDALRDQMEEYHDELNEKIDEINNYIIRLINALDDRLTAAEADIDDLQERMLAAESDIDDLEANKQDKLTAGFGIEIDANNEISVDTDDVQEKLTAGFGIEIDANNEISVDTDDVQEKLIAGQNITLTPDSTDPTKTVIEAAGESYTAGFGIDIDANNEISVDTADVQEKLIAGQNITLTPDATDPTKTVIDVSGVISDYDFSQTSYTFYSQIEQMAVYGTNGSFGKNVDCPNFSTNDVANLENKQHIVLYNAVNGEDQPTGFLTDTSKQITLYIWALVQVVDITLAKTITLANFYNVCGLHFSGEASFKNNVFYSQEIIESAEKLYETIKNNPTNYKFRLQYQVIPFVDGKIPTQSEWGNIATSVGLKLVNRIYFRS